MGPTAGHRARMIETRRSSLDQHFYDQRGGKIASVIDMGVSAVGVSPAPSILTFAPLNLLSPSQPAFSDGFSTMLQTIGLATGQLEALTPSQRANAPSLTHLSEVFSGLSVIDIRPCLQRTPPSPTFKVYWERHVSKSRTSESTCGRVWRSASEGGGT